MGLHSVQEKKDLLKTGTGSLSALCGAHDSPYCLPLLLRNKIEMSFS